jgi:hypothetical protein
LKCYIDAAKLQGKKVSYRHGKVYMDGVIFSKEGLKNIGNVTAPKEDVGGKHSPPLQTAHKKATSPVVETEKTAVAVDHMAPSSARAFKSPPVKSRPSAVRAPPPAHQQQQPLRVSAIQRASAATKPKEKTIPSPSRSTLNKVKPPRVQSLAKKSAVTCPTPVSRMIRPKYSSPSSSKNVQK